MAAGDFGRVGGRNGDAVSAGSKEARTRSWTRLKEGEGEEGREEVAIADRGWGRS